MAHANLIVAPDLFHGVFIIGWCGVDFFFVLSGFIIYYAHSSDIGDPSKFFQYIFKRIKRIYPIYWLYTLGALVIDFGLFISTGKHLVTWIRLDMLKITESFLLWPTKVQMNEMPILPVAWTLSYEIFFYFIFGIVLLVGSWLSLLVVSVWLILMGCAALGLIEQSTPVLIVTLDPRNLEFLFGCFAGYLVRKKECQIHSNYIIGMIFSGIILLILSWYNAYTKFQYANQLNVIQFGLPFFLIVLGLALLAQINSMGTNRLKRIALYLGDASYSIYLIHFLCILALSLIFKKITYFNFHVGLAFVSIIILSVVLGCLFYGYFEKPLLRWIGKKGWFN